MRLVGGLGLVLAFALTAWSLQAEPQSIGESPPEDTARYHLETATSCKPPQGCFVVANSHARVLSLLNEANRAPSYESAIQSWLEGLAGARYGTGARGCPNQQNPLNLQEMDCVTFVESVLAMAYTWHDLRNQRTTPEPDQVLARYARHLDTLRFYDGQVDLAHHRIQYFTDALRLQALQGRLVDVGQLAWGSAFEKPITYLSSKWTHLRGKPEYAKLQQRERALSTSSRHYYPLDSLHRYEAIAQDGDVVGLTTTVPGLDVSHCGFITVDATCALRFTHASSVAKQVVLAQPFREYLGTRTTITGLVVYRPVL